ncbi:unnamed protein product [Musa acuminata var. zebrina]
MKGDKAASQLTLEEYAGFFRNSHLRHHLSHDQLNQIVYMHGFLKLHRLQKAFIVDALNSLDLMRPDRSTVQGQVATPVGVALSLEEAKQDIAALGWQECPLGSIITVGTAADAVEAAVPVSVSTSLSHSKPSSAAGGSAQHKSSGKKKRKWTSAAVASQPSLPPQM